MFVLEAGLCSGIGAIVKIFEVAEVPVGVLIARLQLQYIQKLAHPDRV